ncbi:MAG: transposase, partial [Pseudomonadales bacterium]|nr:transposase [Pseudomonadales bacterium]
QPLKRGRGSGPSYKPSVLVNPARIITAMAVHASSETQVIAAMLDQSKRVSGADAQELLLDAGYFDDTVIDETLKRDISLLCPQGKWPAAVKEQALLSKADFHYDPFEDSYRCPAGQGLILLYPCQASQKTRAYRLYAASAECALRAKCTNAADGRTLKRYPEDEKRDALRHVMSHPQARRIFSQRQAMVEPVFGSMRQNQNLNRFRRKGLRAVMREFALHVLAHNLSRAVALVWSLWGYIFAILQANRASYRRIQRLFGSSAQFSASR